jgi:hypothetical protein
MMAAGITGPVAAWFGCAVAGDLVPAQPGPARSSTVKYCDEQAAGIPVRQRGLPAVRDAAGPARRAGGPQTRRAGAARAGP